MSKCLVRLPMSEPVDTPKLDCWSVDAQGRVQKQQSVLSEMAHSKYAECVVIVPAEGISWHAATLPVGMKLRGDARLQAVLQNQLEESLLSDISQAHVALAADAKPGVASIAAVCDQHWLSAWLRALEAAKLKVSRVLPEVSPEMLEAEGFCVAHGHGTWVTAMRNGLPLTMALAPEAAMLLPPMTYRALAGAYKEAVQSFGAEHAELINEDVYVEMLLRSRWDLAQHQLSMTPLERLRRKGKAFFEELLHAREWRATRFGLYALSLTCVVGLNVSAFMHQRALEKKEALVVQVAQQTFPQLRVILDAPLQMQRELQNLHVAAGILAPQDFQPMLAAAGAALQSQGGRPTSMEYTGAALLLSGLPKDAVTTLEQRLKVGGYVAAQEGQAVRIQAAN